MVETEREIMDTVRSRQKRWSHPETQLITENNLRRTTTGEGLWESKNNGLGRRLLLKTEGGSEELKMLSQDGVSEDGNLPY